MPLFFHESSGSCTTTAPKVKQKDGTLYSYEDLSSKQKVTAKFGWKTLRDNRTGRLYFWHSATGKVQWLPPT